ncbi:MAG: 4'-phosphopantetheinyl transferase superfamily protein [Chloroflexota bacterium]|nr:4'-phosphopantetheinyl transferase superfamily protein [Chloroflexota bacterium]
MALFDGVWRRPTEELLLGRDEVHVWRASLDLPLPRVVELRRVLATEEMERADRFIFERDRRHFTVARGILRLLLGRYLGRAPDTLQFQYSAYGKPALAGRPERHNLHFNLSHSGSLVLYAVTRDREVGVDVEQSTRDVDHEQLARRFFSSIENAALGALPPHQRPEAFFHCWTRKEAYIKAIGEGLSFPLDQFDVSLVPSEPARLLGNRRDPEEVTRWSLRRLLPGPGYVAALVVEGHDWQLSCWQWPD